MRKLAVVVFATLCAACGGGEGTNLTGPSKSIPNVTGNYVGSTTIAFPELGQSLTCPTSTSVTQSGNTISIAPLVMTGPCGNMSIPVGQATIDATGAIPSESGTFDEPSCGTYNYTASGGFFGRDFRLSLNATSRTCYNLNMTITLTH
jgi:hypothetical protein